MEKVSSVFFTKPRTFASSTKPITVRGDANINQISIVKKKDNRRERRALWITLLRQKWRERITRRAQTRRLVRNKGGAEVNKSFEDTSYPEVVKKSYRYSSIKGLSHVKG
jgi:hypothetical protein